MTCIWIAAIYVLAQYGYKNASHFVFLADSEPQNLCLAPNCTAYAITSGDTCQSIANATGNSVPQLFSWNPAIDPGCTNIIAGENICISPPGGIPTLTAIAGATVTQTAIYATATAARPTPVGQGTTTKCGEYYSVHYVSFNSLLHNECTY